MGAGGHGGNFKGRGKEKEKKGGGEGGRVGKTILFPLSLRACEAKKRGDQGGEGKREKKRGPWA